MIHYAEDLFDLRGQHTFKIAESNVEGNFSTQVSDQIFRDSQVVRSEIFWIVTQVSLVRFGEVVVASPNDEPLKLFQINRTLTIMEWEDPVKRNLNKKQNEVPLTGLEPASSFGVCAQQYTGRQQPLSRHEYRYTSSAVNSGKLVGRPGLEPRTNGL